MSGRTVGTGIGSVIGASRHAFRGQWSGAERFAQQQRSDQDSRVGAGRARHAQKRFESTDFPNSMNVCGGDTVSRSLTHVRTAPRAQVVEKMALGGLAAATPREPADKCCGGGVLFGQLAYGASNLGPGLKIRDRNGEQCGSVRDFVMCHSLQHTLWVCCKELISEHLVAMVRLVGREIENVACSKGLKAYSGPHL